MSMADESENRDHGRLGDEEVSRQEGLTYEPNPKHSQPWQAGRKGSLCEPEVRTLAQELLSSSVLWDGKRYAVHHGRGYCAQEHEPDRWHGYPVGWEEVPAKLVRQFIREKKLTKHDRKRFWEGH